MKLKLPHKLQAALMAALASVSFTTLSSGTITAAGVAFFGHQAFADDTADADDPDGTIDTGNTNLDAQAAIDEEEGTGKAKEPGSAPINMAGFNGGPGNNAGLLITESVDIDETALDTVAGSGQQDTVSGTADATPAEDLGFTTNPYATGSDTSNGSDSVFEVTPAAAAAVAATDFQQQATTESTSSGTTPSTTGTATESVATPSGAAGFGGISTPTLGLSTSSLGSTTPAISTSSEGFPSAPLLTGLEANGDYTAHGVTFNVNTTGAASQNKGPTTNNLYVANGTAWGNPTDFQGLYFAEGSGYQANVNSADLNVKYLYIDSSIIGIAVRSACTPGELDWNGANANSSYNIKNEGWVDINQNYGNRISLVNMTTSGDVYLNEHGALTLQNNGSAYTLNNNVHVYATSSGADGDRTLLSGDFSDWQGTITVTSADKQSSATWSNGTVSYTGDLFTEETFAFSLTSSGVSYSATAVLPSYVWAGTSENHAWGNAVWKKDDQGGLNFELGMDALFDGTAGSNQVSINLAVSAHRVTVGGQDYTFDTTGGSLTALKISVTDHQLSLTGTGSVSGAIEVDSGATLNLAASSLAQALLPHVTGAGNVGLTADTTINTGITTAGTGTLSVAASKKLTLGTSTSGQNIDLSSFGGLVLGAGANIDTKATKVTINNLTANGSTINIQDSPSAGSGEPAGISLELKGITTLDGNLTITSDWKYKVNIAALTGNHDLTLAGGQEKHYAEIGDADIHALKMGDNMTNVKLTGTVKLGDNLEAKRGTIEVSGSTSVGRDLDLSVRDAAEGTVLVKSGGSLTTKGMWGRPDAHLYIENGGQLALTDPGLQIVGTGATNAEVSTTSNSSFATNSGNWTISNAAVSTTKDMTLANKLADSSLTTAHNVTLSNAANALTATTVTANTLTVTGDNMALGNVTVSGGTLDLTSTVGTGNLSVASGATLKFAGAEKLTVGGNLALNGTLDVSRIAYAEGATVTLASYTGTANITGYTLSGLGGHEATLSAANNALTLTFNDTPVPPPGPEFGTNLGNVMYVGDSITHGVNSGSYRWSLFQILRDAGIAHNDCGPLTGNSSGGVAVGTLYGGESFSNKRTAIYGAHAYEISDTAPGNCPTSRNDTVWNTANAGEIYANTSINNWLGLSDIKRLSKGGGAYEGEVYDVDTFLMLIGTNDILTDAADGIKNNYETAMPGVLSKLLGATQTGEHSFTFEPDASNTSSVVTIWKSMMESNSDAKVVFMSVPTLGAQHGNAGSANIMKAVHVYNEALEQWCTAHGVRYVQSDTGIVDVSNALGAGVRSMFQNDGTHPSFQGDLIFAGNIAKAMGYAGRTIGLDRADAAHPGETSWTTNSSVLVTSAVQTVQGAEFTATLGYTVDFNAVYGNGTTGGWDNDHAFSITVGDGTHSGTLSLTEAYVKWGDKILYSKNNSLTGDNLRIAYVNSSVNASDNVTAGYYVWLGDQLIGEALTGSGNFNGIRLQSTGVDTTISTLSWTDAAYAPMSSGFINADDAFHLVQVNPNPVHDNPEKQGIDNTIEWVATTDFYTLKSGQSSTAETLYKEHSSNIGANYTGAANANYTGKIGMHYTGTENFDAKQSILSVWNATVTGDVYMLLDNPNTVYDSFTKQAGQYTSMVATWGGSITGKYTATINAGILPYNVYGGAHTGNNTSIGGGSHIYINGGQFGENVYGGGRVASAVINNGTYVTVTGGSIAGSVYGGGVDGTINGGSHVTITGGIIKGDVNGGGTGGTINGGTAVVIEGNLPSIGGNITADNVTLKNVELNTAGYNDGFDWYSGTITGTKKITLYNYTVADMRASLVTQTLEALNSTSTTIHNLHLTACEVIVEGGSSVTLADTLTLGNTATYSGALSLQDNLVIDMEDLGSSSASGAQAATSGYRSGTWDVMKLAEGASAPSLAVNAGTLQGAGALKGFAFSYDDQTGTLSAAGSDYTTYYLEQVGDSVNLTTQQAAHPELQHVVLNAASGTVEVSGTNTLTTASLAQNSALTFDVGGSLVVNGTITGTGASVVKTGVGTMTVNGNNTFSGGLTVNEGTVAVTSKDNLGTGTITANANGTILFTSNDFATVDSLAVQGAGALRLVSSARSEAANALNTISASNLYLEDNSSNTARYYYDGSTNLSGVQHLYFDGGQLWLGSNMTFAGTTTFNATTYSEGTGNLNNAAIRASSNATFSGPVVINDTARMTIFSGNAVEFSGTISGSGNIELKEWSGNGTFKVSKDASNYQGALTSDAGITLNVADGAKLTLAEGSSVAGPVTLDGELTMSTAADASSTISGAISGSGTITKTGDGTLNLTNTGTRIANLTVADGTVNMTGGNGSGQGMVKNTLTIQGGGTMNITDHHDALGWGTNGLQNLVMEGSDGNVAKLNFAPSHATATVTAGFDLDMKGYSQITGRAFNTFEGSSIHASGKENSIEALQMRNAATVDIDANGELSIASLSQFSGSSGALTKTGAGTLILTGNTTNTTTNVNAGTLALTSSVGSIGGNLTIKEGATLTLSGADTPVSTSGTFSMESGSTLDLSNYTFTDTGSVTLVSTSDSGSIVGPASWDDVNLTFAGTSPENAHLEVQGNSLVLTFGSPVEPKNLIWDNAAGNNTWDAGAGASANWHEAESAEHVTFTNRDNATFDSADATVTMNGAVTAGTMTVGSRADVTIVTGAGNTLNVANGITIAEGGMLAQSGTGLSGTLHGAGTYDQTGKSLHSVRLGDDWTGAVRLTNQELNSTGPNQKWLAGLRNENSWIEMNGFTGYDSSWASSAGTQWGDLTANIRLLDGEDGKPAWKFNASASTLYTMYATGNWEGDGTFLMSAGTSTQSQGVKFTGDISGWTGLLATDAVGERTVTFAESANKVNAEIDTLGSGALNVIVDNAATFSKNVDATKLTINSGKSATLTGGAQIDTLAGAGKLVVDGANTTTTIGSGSDFTGGIDLLGGTLDLTNALTGVGAVNLGTGSSAATLKLAGGENAALTSTGSITLGNNLTFDLSNYNSSLSPVEGGTTSVTLATATGFSGDAGSVSLTGLSLEEGYKASLSVDNTTNLVLTISDESENLVWLDAAGTWTAKNSWYQNDPQTRNTFQNGDSVTIVGGKYDEDTTIRMVADASARNMTVTKADDVSDATVIIQDTVNQNRLAAKNLTLQEGTTLVINTQLEVTESMVLNNNTELKLNSPKDATISADISAAEGAQNAVITKRGDNTLTLTGVNTYYNGAIDVTDGTLVAQGTSSLGSSSVIVEDGAALSLAARDSMWGMTLDLKGNSTITFLGDTELTLYGSLTLGDNVTWDLSRYGFDRPAQGETTATATLIRVETIDQASIARLLATTSDYISTPGIVSNARLSYDSTNSSVILTYDMDSQGDLFWMGGVGNWNGNSDNLTWYPSREGGQLTQFYKGDNVTFDNRAAVSPVTLTEDITAGTVTVENGTRVTLQDGTGSATLTAENVVVQGGLNTHVNVAAGTVNIADTGTWTVIGDTDRSFAGEITGTGTLAKSGTGDLELAHSNTAFTGEIQLNSGTITAADADALGTGTTIAMANGTELKQAEGVTALNMGGKTIEVTDPGTSATVSANLDVAADTILTFAGDGNLAVTQAVTGTGTLTQAGYGTLRLDDVQTFQGSIVVNQGGVALGSATSSVNSINVGINTALTFAGSGMMDINTLTLANGSTVDLTNVTFTDNHATLAIVSTLNAPVSASSGTNYYRIEGVSVINAQGVDEGSVVRLGYRTVEGNKTEFYAEIIPQPTGDNVVFWKGAGPNDTLGYDEGSGIWTPTNIDTTKAQDTALGYLVDAAGNPTYFKARDQQAHVFSTSINFGTLYDSKGELIREATVNVKSNPDAALYPLKIQHIRTMIIEGDTKYIIQAYDNASTENDLQLSPNAVSTLLVKSGAQAEIRTSFTSKDASLVQVEEGATLDFIAQDANNLEEFSFVDNRGDMFIKAGNVTPVRLTNSGTIVIEGTLNLYETSEGMYASVNMGEIVNTGTMTVSGDAVVGAGAGAVTQVSFTNEGDLTFMGKVSNPSDQMIILLPTYGRGVVNTDGDKTVVFDRGWDMSSFPFKEIYATVDASELNLGAASTVFNSGVDITGATTVKAGKDAYFYGGGIDPEDPESHGKLGELTLEDEATITFGPYVYYGEVTAQSYDMGHVTAGADSVLTVQKGATVTMDGYNAASGVPAGEIVVGTMPTDAPTGYAGTASLTIDGPAAVDTVTVLADTATITGNASINQIMQDGGELTLNANSVLNGTTGNGGTVTGGTLKLGTGVTLDQNAVIDVRDGGAYTVSGGTGSRIDATGLELIVDRTNTLYREVVKDSGKPVISDDALANRSGFISSGDEYVKLFDMAEGTTLTSKSEGSPQGEAVYHASASGMMTLIGTDNWEAIQASIGASTFNVEEHIGYGYLHTADLARKTYYVRDAYATDDSVTLSDIVTASIDPSDPLQEPQLANVVFDKTVYNKDATPYNGTLTVDANVAVDLFSVSSDAKAAINIADGTTVTADADSPGVQGKLDLQGAGVYQITDRNDLGANIALRDDEITAGGEWDGTVRVSGTSTDLTLEDKSVGTDADASTIEFRNWNGALNGGNHEIDARIQLTSTQAAPTAMKLTGEDDIAYTFTNTVSGGGNINHAEGGNVAMTFTGDTSGWNGTYEQLSDTEDSLTFTGGTTVNADVTSGNGTMNLTYGGSVETVAGDVNVYSGGDTPTTMNVAYTGEYVEVTGGITSDAQSRLSLTVGDGTTESEAVFSGAFTGTENATMTVKGGSAAVINTDATLQCVVGETGSSVTVADGATLSLASTDPETGYSEFHDLTNEGTIEMMANGGAIHLVDDTAEGNTYNLGNLVLTDPVGTATIETSGVEGKTTNVNITGLVGPKSAAQVLELMNGNATGTVNYNLGNTDDTKDLNGTIAYGVNGGNGAVTNLVIQDNGNSAASAVLETRFANANDPAEANIVVDTHNGNVAHVLGLSSDANSFTDGKTMVVSGSEGGNKTLEITGDGEYNYAGQLGANLDVAYTGEGMQVINGGVSGFDGKVTVDNGSTAAGVLALLNTASVDITDLTIGANDTLVAMKTMDENGTAVVSGTLTAQGRSTTEGSGTASTLYGDLKLGDTSTLDVSAAGGIGGLNLTGTLTINSGAMLSSGDMGVVWNMGVGDIYDLAFGVTAMSGFDSSIDWNEGVDASTVFGNGMKEGEFVLRYSGGSTGGNGGNVGAVYLFRLAVPEPTTGTLSLLALAALAARRRRK